jgi:DNA-binding NtrC family response regulator
MITTNILLVDDHPLVRNLTLKLVRFAGYRADAVATGAEALAALDGGRFDILLTDFRLGGALNGVELAANAESKHPGIGVIVMTAYTRVELGPLPARYRLLEKPFSVDELAAATAALQR